MGGGHSCENGLTAAKAKLATLEAQLSSESSSSCSKNLSAAKAKLKNMDAIKATAAHGANSCTESMPANQAQLSALQSKLASMNNSPCNQQLKTINSQLTALQQKSALAKSQYNSLVSNASNKSTTANQQISALQAQLAAAQQKYNALKNSTAGTASACSNNLILAHQKVLTLEQKLAATLQANLQKSASLNTACDAKLTPIKNQNNANLNALKSQIISANTKKEALSTTYNTETLKHSTCSNTYQKNMATDAKLTADFSTASSNQTALQNQLTALQTKLSNLDTQLGTLNSQTQSLNKTANSNTQLLSSLNAAMQNDQSAYGTSVQSLQSAVSGIKANMAKYPSTGTVSYPTAPYWGWCSESICTPNTYTGPDGFNIAYNKSGGYWNGQSAQKTALINQDCS